MDDNINLTVLRRQIILEERERIAADLHDDLAQALTFILTTSTAIRMKCIDKNDAEVTDQLLRIEETTQDLLDSLRLTIFGLKVTEKLEPGVFSSIKNFSIKYSQLARIPIELEIDPQVYKTQLDPKTELQLFRIVQEALVNIHKHSNASIARIEAVIQNQQICLLIEDNGEGFDTQMPGDNSFLHFGITSMYECANRIGASFEINSQIGKGTQIAVSLPHRSKG